MTSTNQIVSVQTSVATMNNYSFIIDFESISWIVNSKITIHLILINCKFTIYLCGYSKVLL